MAKLTHPQRARRYLQASMSAGYQGLPREHREAYESQMRSHERAYGRVREHALAGANQDFDKPLTAGEREHQRHLQEHEGLEHAEVLRIRRELRGEHTSPSSPPRRTARRRNPTFAGPRAARSAARSAGGAIADVTGTGGGGLMYLIGVMLGLSLIYLLVAGKGAGALTGIVAAVTGAAGAFINPTKDPIATLERALGATPITSSPPPPSGVAGSSSPAPVRASSSAGPAGFIPAGATYALRRKDAGRDVQLAPGAALTSPGSFQVERVASDPSGFGPDYPIIKELSGPDVGQELYYGHTDTALPAGSKIYPAGTVVAHTSKTGHNAPPGWLELGFAHNAIPGPVGQRSPF